MAEHRAAGDHGLSHYSKGFTEKFCQGVPLRGPKIVFPEMSAMMNDHALSITTTN